LLGYCPVNNGATVSAWDLDEINVSASCVESSMSTFAVSGNIKTENGVAISNVEVKNKGIGVIEYPILTSTDAQGTYLFESNPEDFEYEITGEKNVNYLNGITTLDILFIQKHILALKTLDSPYKMIAADVNQDFKINGLDIIQLRKLLLGYYANDELPNNDSWKFIDQEMALNTDNVWMYQEKGSILSLVDNEIRNFTAVKIGDLNSSAVNNFESTDAETRNDNSLSLVIKDQELKAGTTYKIPVTANNFEEIAGFQFSLESRNAEIINLVAGVLNISEGNYSQQDSRNVNISWNTVGNLSYDVDEVLFWIELKASNNGSIAEQLLINNSSLMNAEAYKGSELSIINTDLEFLTANGEQTVFVLYQNQPNPFRNVTNIQFSLPFADEATLSIYDVNGKIIKRITRDYTKGQHSELINFDEFGVQSGIYYYVLESSSNKAIKKLVLIE
jgi:hypothetical protein